MSLHLIVPPCIGGIELCSPNGICGIHEDRVLPHDLGCLVLERAQPVFEVTHLRALLHLAHGRGLEGVDQRRHRLPRGGTPELKL